MERREYNAIRTYVTSQIQMIKRKLDDNSNPDHKGAKLSDSIRDMLKEDFDKLVLLRIEMEIEFKRAGLDALHSQAQNLIAEITGFKKLVTMGNKKAAKTIADIQLELKNAGGYRYVKKKKKT